MTITLRLEKGSELTFQELDNNFSDLNGRVTTLESGSGSGGIALTDLSVTTNIASGGGTLTYSNATGVFTYTPPDLSSYTTTAGLNTAIDGHLNTGTATANQILSWDGADYAWVADQTGGGGGGLANVVEDTTPQLGGDLDGQAFNITTTGKILYSNMYSQLADLPSATTYHGMFAHVHATGKAYYAHGGNWIELANQADIGGGANVTVQDDAPTSPAPTQGDLWWESDVGTLKIYYSGAWVDASPAGNGTGGGSATNMASLTDVDSVDTVASGDFLLYDGSSSEYKFVAFEAEVNGLIDSRTGGSGHISTQSQYTTTVTTDAADPTDASHHVLSNTGTPSVQGASTAWYYGDVVSDPANPTTSVVLDIDGAILTADVVGNITSAGTSTFSGTVDFSNTSNVDFTGATVSGLSGSTWATLGDKDGANGPTSIVLGRNAIAQGPYGFALGNAALSDAYGMAFGMETQAAGYGVQIGAFSGKNHVATNSLYSVGIGSFTHQNANPGDETGSGAIALGSYAGDANQGGMAVALGYMAGRNNQAANSIVLNATGIELENLTPNSFVVKPIRNAPGAQALYYDPTSGEVTYDAAPGGGLANVVDDTTPQLGGDLDLNNNNITGTGDILINGNLKVQNIQEEFATLTGATGTVTHDCDLQNIFYHTSPAADFTANITNLTLIGGNATTVSLVISQGATAYIPTAVQIGGVAQTLNWQGGSAPSGTNNGIDVVSLSILNNGGTYIVLGQLVGFG